MTFSLASFALGTMFGMVIGFVVLGFAQSRDRLERAARPAEPPRGWQ